jgi:NDP-sugar pyrophosphorylase family protein
LFPFPAMKAADLFDLPPSLALFAGFFRPDAAPWEWLARIKEALASPAARARFALPRPPLPPNFHVAGDVFISGAARLSPNATILGPAWIGDGVEIRQGAYVRGNVIAGAGCVIGNSTEVKNSLLLEGVQAPHFNYVGDSVLGNRAHLGAGVICSNLRLDQRAVVVQTPGGPADTGLRKLGALLGDGAEAGCNSVLNPGAILGRRALLAPLTSFSGFLPGNTLARAKAPVARLPRPE